MAALIASADEWVSVWARLYHQEPGKLDAGATGVFRPLDAPIPTARGIMRRRIVEPFVQEGRVREGADTVEISDAVNQAGVYLREFADAEEISDTPNPAGTYLRELVDTEEISEDIADPFAYMRDVADAEEISEDLADPFAYMRSPSSTIEIDHQTGPNSVYRRHGDNTVQVVTNTPRIGTNVRVPASGGLLAVTEGHWQNYLRLGEPSAATAQETVPNGAVGTWSFVGGAAADTTIYQLGARSIKTRVNNTILKWAFANFVIPSANPLDLSDFMEFRTFFYKDTDPDVVIGNHSAKLVIRFQDKTGGRLQLTIPGFIKDSARDAHPHRQWIELVVPLGDLTTTASTINWAQWQTLNIELSWETGTGTDLKVYFDNMRFKTPDGNAFWYLVDLGTAQVLRHTTADTSRKTPMMQSLMEEDRTETNANLTNQILLGDVKASDLLLHATVDAGSTPTDVLIGANPDDIGSNLTLEGPTGEGPGGGLQQDSGNVPIPSDPHDESGEDRQRQPFDPEGD